MRLVLMRHADAGDADPARWPGDRERPLTDAGRREHARVAAALRRMGVVFDRILTSPLARARETADITSRAYGGLPAPEPSELLGDRAEPARTLAGLATIEAERLLCVGHEPTLSRLAGLLISRDGSARVEMRKSGVAVIDCPGPVGSGRGTLQLHLRPREIVALADGLPAGSGAALSRSVPGHADRVPAQCRAPRGPRPGPVHRDRGRARDRRRAGRALPRLGARNPRALRLPHRGRAAREGW